MRYTVPVNAAAEVGSLVAAGASELYLGYQDGWWTQRYGGHDSASRRQGRANLSTLRELAAVVDAASTYDLPVWLTLNSRYTEPQLDHLVSLCHDFEQMGGTGVIASDLGLLWRLREEHGLKRCLSILAVAQNRETIAAYARLSISRVVFPRFVQPEEAGRLLSSTPGIEGEFMAFFDKCPWVDGYCRHRHGVTYASREVPPEGDDAPELHTFDTTYRTHACLGRACTYLEPYPCAACYLHVFDQHGVHIAKLGGRGRPLDDRVRALRFLREAEHVQDDEERCALYQKTFGCAQSCYYGQATQKRSAIEPIDPALPQHARQGVIGSQSDAQAFREAMRQLLSDDSRNYDDVTLLIPPLSDEELMALINALPQLCANYAGNLCLCANDLGTLVALARERKDRSLSADLTMGTLLARSDDPHEVAHFLSPAENPPRGVWGPSGEPRMLVYQKPSAELVRHWQHPSLTEPSAQQALRMLTGLECVPYLLGRL